MLKALKMLENKKAPFLWPEAWPHFAWGSWLLTAPSEVNTGGGRVIDLKEGFKGPLELHQALLSCKPKLSLLDLARLWQQSQEDPSLAQDLNWTELVNHCGLRSGESLTQVLESLLKTPASFQTWSEEKQLAPRDLNLLLSFESEKDKSPDLVKTWENLLDKLAETSTSKSTGVKIMELGGELLLMGKQLPSWSHESPEHFARDLERVRFPLSHQSLEAKNQELKQWAWPSRSSGRWLRQGDELLMEIKILAPHGEELKKRLDQMKSLLEGQNG